jgi:regulator of protease activity HflC (stomatin/prohibitin superfamily)
MNQYTRIGLVVLATGIFLAIILILCSLRVVKPEEYAIEYNKIWRNINYDQIFTQGRFVMKPATRLIRYPRVYQPIDFTQKETELNCISKDGMVVRIDVVSQYRYLPDGLINMLFKFDYLSHSMLMNMARSAFINTCSYYEVESGFIKERQNISNHMLFEYQKKMFDSNISTLTEFGELRNYHYPQEYLDAITDKQIAQQQIDFLLNQRHITIKNAETDWINANKQREIDLQKSYTEALAIIQSANSTAQSITTYWQQYTNAFKLTLDKLKIDPDTFVEKYLSQLPLDNNNNTIYWQLT